MKYKLEEFKDWLEEDTSREKDLPDWEGFFNKFKRFTAISAGTGVFPDKTWIRRQLDAFSQYLEVYLAWQVENAKDILKTCLRYACEASTFAEVLARPLFEMFSSKTYDSLYWLISLERDFYLAYLGSTSFWRELDEHLLVEFYFQSRKLKVEVEKKDQEIERIQEAHEAFLDTQLDFYKASRPELWREFAESNPPALDVGNLLNFLEAKLKVQEEKAEAKEQKLNLLKANTKHFLTKQIQLIKGVIE